MEKKITITSFPYGFNEVFLLIQEIETSGISKVIIDISRITYVVPSTIVSLVSFIIFAVKRKTEIEIYLPYEDHTKNYLKDIKLVDFCKQSIKGQIFRLNEDIVYPLVPIEQLKFEQLASYIQFVKIRIEQFTTGKDLSFVDICISEIINNIYDHSTDQAYCFFQVYKNKKTIIFSACDLGIGIITKVRNYLGNSSNNMSDTECLKWALTLGKTTRSQEHNAGKGLDNIKFGAKNSKSDLKIFTNNIHFLQDENGYEHFEKNPIENFKGTLIEVKINIENLPQKDLEFTTFDF